MRHTPARCWRLLALWALFLAAGANAAEGQIFHRERCSRPDCPAATFRLEVERMTLTEGPLAADRDEGDLRELKGRIEAELQAHPGDAWLWMALSEAELGLGDPLAAMTAVGRALELGMDSALVMRQRGAARMRMAGGELEGAQLYLAAVARMTRADSPRFLADHLPMLSANELDWWRSADVETLRTWVRDYWEHRAALAGVSAEERLVEHMRRSAAASRMFAPPGTGSGAAGDGDVLRQTALRDLPYDDRGLVYIRRGPPHREVRVASDIFEGLPATTWLYASVDGGIDAFHFAKQLTSGSGFRLVTPPACDPDYAGSGLAGANVVSVSEGWVMTSAGASSEATHTALSCFGGDAQARRANASLNAIALRRETMRALAVESPRQPFLEAIPAFFDFYVFRGPNGETEVVTPVVVPVAAGEQEEIELLVTFADQGGGVIRREATSTTTRARVTQSIISDGEGWGVAYARTTVQPADSAWFRVVIRDPSNGERGGMWGGSISLRSFAGRRFSMSDVVVSGPGPGTFTRGSTRLFLLPARSFVPGATATVFYELYHAEPGTAYRTELRLRREDAGLGARLWRAITGAGEVRLRFDGVVPADAGETLQELRSLGLPAEEGRYILSVRVTNARGQTTETTGTIEVSRDAAAPATGNTEPSATRPADAEGS